MQNFPHPALQRHGPEVGKRARALMGRDAGSRARLVCPAQLPAQVEASTSLSLRQNYRTWTAEYDHPPTDQLPLDICVAISKGWKADQFLRYFATRYQRSYKASCRR